MQNPEEYGRELADEMIPKLESRFITGVESARIVAIQIGRAPTEAIEAGEPREHMVGWVEAVIGAYLNALRERMETNEAQIARN
jgi:hypothetical protein